MKLWVVSQWGNKDEGPNGEDTNCVIRSNDMMEAIEFAENIFLGYMRDGWNKGKANAIYLLGDDGREDDHKTKQIIDVWRAHAFNRGGYPSWHRDWREGNDGKWAPAEELFDVKDPNA
jgi:hypothetical protein